MLEQGICASEGMYDMQHEVAVLKGTMIVHDFEDVDGVPTTLTIYSHTASGRNTIFTGISKQTSNKNAQEIHRHMLVRETH